MADEKVPAQTQTKKVDVSSKPIFSWQSPEFVRYSRDKKWFFFAVLITIVLAGVFILLKQWSSVVLVAVAGSVFIALSNAHPKNIICALYNEGVVVDGKVYDFSQFKSFWLSGNADLPKISLQQTGRFGGHINMPTKDQDFEQIRLFLAKHLPEEQPKEDLSDIISRTLKL